MSLRGREKLEVDSVRTEIQRYRTLGDYIGGRDYFESLPTHLQCMKAIGIEIAQLYLVQGHYRKADEICTATAMLLFPEDAPQSPLPDDVWDEESVCLELCRAYTNIMRSGNLENAMRVAKLVCNIWLAPRGGQIMLSYETRSC